MLNSRNARHAGGGVARFLMTVILASVAAMVFSLSTGSSARADDLPFWERDDAAKAAVKTSKKSASNKSSKKYAKAKSEKSYAGSTKKLGGYAEQTEAPKKHKKGVKVASLGDDNDYVAPKSKKSLSGGSVNWLAESGCLDGNLKAIIYDVASNYGPVRVNSTCRSKGHNAAVGGAPKSKHLSGDAVDFRVSGNISAVYAYLKGNGGVGGLKHYGGGLFHIDNGDRRSW